MADDRIIPPQDDSKYPFYVYVYYDPREDKNNEPIYVGKGTRDRSGVHWTHGARNRFFKSVLKKIRALNLKPLVEIVERFDSEQDAHNAEKELISYYGRRDLGLGPLLNLTDGGEGVCGLVVSD